MTMLGSAGSTGHEGSPRVLVAEDDRSVRESLVMALGLDGYDVHAMSDGGKCSKLSSPLAIVNPM